MIYPPISELVEKAGNRYSLVIITAKRAREIAQEERKDRDNAKLSEQDPSKQRLYDRGRQSRNVKPIIKSLDEIINGKVHFGRADECSAKKAGE